MRVRTTCDGRLFIAETPQQMVMFLWKSAWMQESGPHKYMTEVAKRAKLDKGVEIRSDSPEHFLADMALHGYIEVEDDTNWRTA